MRVCLCECCAWVYASVCDSFSWVLGENFDIADFSANCAFGALHVANARRAIDEQLASLGPMLRRQALGYVSTP